MPLIKENRAWLIALLALFLGAVLQQGSFWHHVFAPDDRIMAPIQSSRSPLGDEYYYYILSKKAPLRLQNMVLLSDLEKDSFFLKNSGLENVYSGALLVAGVLDQVAQMAPISWPFKALLSFILQTSILIASLMIVYSALRKSNMFPWIEMLLFSFIWCYFMSGFMYATYSSSVQTFFTAKAISYFPDILRIVNPQLGWAYAFIYSSLVCWWYVDPTSRRYASLVIMSLLFGVFSIPLVMMFIIGFGLILIATLIKEKRLDLRVVNIVVALIASFLYTYYQIQLLYATEKGQELMTGNFVGFNIKPHYFLLLIFIPLIRKTVAEPVRSPLIAFYLAALLIGCISESFELGSRLWLRGTSAFAWLLVAFSVTEWVRLKIQASWRKPVEAPLISMSAALALLALGFFGLEVKFNQWTGYIEREKGEVIQWLRENTTRNDVVLSPDLEDAYFIPLYTNAQPYVQLFDYGVLTPKESVNRYLQALDLVGLKDSYVSKITSYTKQKYTNDGVSIFKRPDQRMQYDDYQTFAFYGVILYYPYTRSSKDIFKSAELKEKFNESIIEMARHVTSKDIKDIDYLILKNVGMRLPLGYRIRYENTLYQIASIAPLN